MSLPLLLIIGIVVFYVFDTTMLLYADEVLFEYRGARWRARVGNGFMIAGRYPLLAAFCSPGAAVVLARWAEPKVVPHEVGVEQLLANVLPLRWHARGLALLLFAIVPACLLFFRHPPFMLALMLVIYLGTAVVMLIIARRRKAFGLSRVDVAAIAFDVMLCPPFALHLVRRICSRCRLNIGAQEFARSVLPEGERLALSKLIEQRMDEIASSCVINPTPSNSDSNQSSRDELQ